MEIGQIGDTVKGGQFTLQTMGAHTSLHKELELKGSEVKFSINGKLYTVGKEVPLGTRLVDYVRDVAGLKGTKYMCREGGCGVCTVMVKSSHPVTKEELVYSVNACLVFVQMCNGWAITTIEGLGSKKHGYHTVQSRLANMNGTQCGYCSPGMVMAMQSFLEGHKEKVSKAEIEAALGGNICRCTGYRPILDTFQSFASDPSERVKQKCLDIEDLCNKDCKKPCNGEKPCNGNCSFEGAEFVDASALELSQVPCSVALNDKWFIVSTVEEIFQIFDMIPDDQNYMLVAGSTAHGVYRIRQPIVYFIQINNVTTLRKTDVTPDSLVMGASTTLTEAMDLFDKMSQKYSQFKYLSILTDHLNKVAHHAVRNVGTIGGNLAIKHAHPEFPSDLFLLLETVGATLTIRESSGLESTISPAEFLQTNMNKKLIISITFSPKTKGTYYLRTFKIMPRAQNAHAIVNAGFLFNFDPADKMKKVTAPPCIVYGGISSQFVHATNLEQQVVGKSLLNQEDFKSAINILSAELKPSNSEEIGSIHLTPEPEFDATYRKNLALSLFYKFVLGLSKDEVSPKYISGAQTIQDERPVSDGQLHFNTDKKMWPLTKPIPKIDGLVQCAGEAEYVNDIPRIEGELFAAVLMADRGPAKIKSIDASKALKQPGVHSFITAKDIPGKNIMVELNEAEKIFAEDEVQYAGQFIGAIIADNIQTATEAIELIKVTYSELKKPQISLRKIVESGNTSRVKKGAEITATTVKPPGVHKFKGTVELGGQYYYTMEPQTALCVPSEDGVDVFAASQWVTLVQEMVAGAINLSNNRVNVKTRRVGGGYGSKLSRSCFPAVIAAVCSSNINKPVKVVMPIETMSSGLGRRYSIFATYEGSADEKGVIQTLNSTINVDEGATLNENSIDVMALGLRQISLYESSTWSVVLNSVVTDSPTTTWTRSPGMTEIAAYIEHIMEHIALVVKVDAADVRVANLSLPQAKSLLQQVRTDNQYDDRARTIVDFNEKNRWRKKGISLSTTVFPIGFFDTSYAILSVFKKDATVAILTSGIEIGQGLHTKVAQACAYELNIPIDLIVMKPSLSHVFPNSSGTGGSTGSDQAAWCIIQCCKELKLRLQPVYDKNPGKEWKDIIFAAANQSIDLQVTKSLTPTQNPDQTKPYSVLSAAITEIELDILTGQHQVTRVDILQDAGISVNPDIDVGQIQGAFIMGLGNWTTEHMIRNEDTGALMSNRTWNYKPPGAKDIPVDFRVTFLKADKDPRSGPYGGKAVGEPPLLTSCSVMYAIKMAIKSARKDAGLADEYFDMSAPFTSENIFLHSGVSHDKFLLK
uniref:Xanthine dehydrogenase n=2 Tax=Cacopsylla melanoneura TaxID=428564 RepID=A0A8D8U4Z5_9HEMI